MEEINFKTIEDKWQKNWEKAQIFESDDNSKKDKYYVLEMFPYPSGSGIHMGHAYNFVLGDILARFKLLNQFNVLHPMGWDALGLPAENAAIKDGTHPEDYTKNSIPNFIKQQKRLGITYDWAREINTASPEYYKWDQWIFLKMLEKGLAYQKTSAVNWCPSCTTVLANEQAQTGKCDRCDTKVEIKHLRQWFLKITDYADELYEGIDQLDWPEKTKAMQKNWIGKSHGTEINFKINDETWPVFTTRPDTIFGVTFVVISAQHEKLMGLVTADEKENIKKFLKKVKSVSEKDLADMEKIGAFTGSYAINPANGTEVPVYAGNFVVADYGSGMVMAVPAHDQRDFEFAKKYDIEIKQVITNKDPLDFKNRYTGEKAFTEPGILMGSKQFSGMMSEDAKEEISEWLISEEKAKKVTNFRLRDWGISRQRYWGTPIPIIHCKKCGAVPVPESDLPIILPKNVKFGEGNPLESANEWIKTQCPKCGEEGRRETDTMDTFANSSWYFMRYCDPHNNKEIFNKKKVNTWCPVDTYIGGAEHACMHLIYSRFYTKFLRDLGLINFNEPAKRLFHQGMINGADGEKMSKSKGNGVEPLETMAKYGVDTTRLFIVSVAAPDKGFNWNDKGMNGALRFIKKIFTYINETTIGKTCPEIESNLNKTIKNVTEYYDSFDYRKATIELRELFDKIAEHKETSKDTLEKFLKLLNPICPHVTEELWEKLGHTDFISTAQWPKATEIESKENSEKNSTDILISNIKPITDKFPNKRKVYLYVLPFEINKINEEELSQKLNKEITVYSVKDPDKYDPENKAKKAKPSQPGIYLE